MRAIPARINERQIRCLVQHESSRTMNVRYYHQSNYKFLDHRADLLRVRDGRTIQYEAAPRTSGRVRPASWHCLMFRPLTAEN
jgi:hypothetical protein